MIYQIVCACGYDTDRLPRENEVVEQVKNLGGYYDDDYNNRCPQCGMNHLELTGE